jgi:hypothetical protein
MTRLNASEQQMVSLHITAMAVSIALMARALHLYRGEGPLLPAPLQTALQVVGVAGVFVTVLGLMLLAGEVRAWDH